MPQMAPGSVLLHADVNELSEGMLLCFKQRSLSVQSGVGGALILLSI